jgi:oxygen-independent coproporphyrinogen-3 oxidase
MESYRLTEAERETYRRYAGLALPRHTSYPIAPLWKPTFQAGEMRAALERSAAGRRSLSLYIHIPYCQRLCWYCACTKEIVPSARRQTDDPSETLLRGLEIEAGRFAKIMGAAEVNQLHLGGGTPTFLDASRLKRLSDLLRRRFHIAEDAEIAIEIDPRAVTRQQLTTLRGAGFNRVSLGIQDFDPHVQQAVNRIQPLEVVERTVCMCRELGFSSVNFDLIYGLPFQTVETMAATLEKTIALKPDRIAFYRLAVIPEIFRWQNVFRHTDLPEGDES